MYANLPLAMSAQIHAQVVSLKRIKPDIFLLCFKSSYLAKKCRPGNFLHIQVPPAILRRPFSVYDVRGERIFILFRVRGRGTALLAQYKKGDGLNILGPLGRGFVYTKKLCLRKPNILLAGGLGVAPLLFLARHLKNIGCKQLTVILGVKTKNDLLCAASFRKIGCKVFTASDDHSIGFAGNAVELLKEIVADCNDFNIYCCGPEPMFKALGKVIKNRGNISCQVSFEQFMGCGLGICCGCTIETKNGYKKVCKDGPVFNLRDVYCLP